MLRVRCVVEGLHIFRQPERAILYWSEVGQKFSEYKKKNDADKGFCGAPTYVRVIGKNNPVLSKHRGSNDQIRGLLVHICPYVARSHWDDQTGLLGFGR
jgi:hypothetical protein